MRRLITNVLKSDNSAFKPKTHVKFAEAATTTRKTVRKYKTTKMLGRISRKLSTVPATFKTTLSSS